MSTPNRMWLIFAVIWFGTKTLDYLFGDPNPAFNAALATTAAMIEMARSR